MLFQFTIKASDSRGRFTQSAYANMTVTVDRNQPPRFINLPNSESVAETRDIGEVIFDVDAQDFDLRPGVSSYLYGVNVYVIA